ncbi:WW domain-containing protein [Zea mays]|uniref:WW domain-containing protein n=1 Tax=Zea mays TaxID=4577 RepID=A0A1D6NZC6_MAIZE|nr:WW domain-containing protein [Zea mays]AQL03254.1 WW domain-containing protein [Zea mays]AQL03262.1 WW domain-containing protein [Zea mays]AQL03272.1 WW domain-containing protein [Zea mays]
MGISGCDCSLLDKKENPLALLGQYSDDEEENEETTDQPTDEAKRSPGDASAKLSSPCVDTAGNNGVARTEPSVSVGDQQEAPQAGDIKNYTQSVTENTIAPEPILQDENVKSTESVPDSSGMQIVGEVGGNWRAIMHEQSNQCYYWNTVTGETSWDIPNGLASGAATASVPSDVGYSIEAQAHVLPHSTLEAYPSDMSVGNGTSTFANFGMACGSAQVTQDAYAYAAPIASHEPMDIDPLYLAKYGDDLLQRLNLLERLCGLNEGLELIRREIGIRISDCNALSSYGSSLLPLWMHAEVHLKQLDSSISRMEMSYHADTEHRNSKTEVVEHNAPDGADLTTPSNGEALKSEVSPGITIDENVEIDKPTSILSAQDSQGRDIAAVPPKVESDNDQDMDVEMEVDEDNVEEQAHCSSVPKKEHPPSEQLSSTNLPSFEDPTPEDNSVPPPPPEEEWIPPPPPENEPAPPDPPKEPAASYVQVDAIPQPYIAQENVGYTISGMEYYGIVGTEGTNANYYMQVSEPHVLQAQQHSYYAPVSGSGVSVSVDGTSIAPESYYTHPSVTMAASAVAAEHSVYYASSISAISSSAADIKTSSASLVSANSNSDLKGPDKLISNDASIVPLTQAVVATSGAGTPSVLGSSTQPSSSTKNLTKVTRNKKRAVGITSSLRSNKKVSSLVDKWKAAKEELRNEEEEEPESALEALERKRQKEIEEWRKQQIASGEAQENANFIPVRGDWRDRVKRKRAQAKNESKDDIVAASLGSSEQHKGPPDLAELSKDLPTGWQVSILDCSISDANILSCA